MSRALYCIFVSSCCSNFITSTDRLSILEPEIIDPFRLCFLESKSKFGAIFFFKNIMPRASYCIFSSFASLYSLLSYPRTGCQILEPEIIDPFRLCLFFCFFLDINKIWRLLFFFKERFVTSIILHLRQFVLLELYHIHAQVDNIITGYFLSFPSFVFF